MKKVTVKIMKLTGMLLFAIMLSLCMVMGVAPVLPKRKEQFAIEIKAEQADKKEDAGQTLAQFGADG